MSKPKSKAQNCKQLVNLKTTDHLKFIDFLAGTPGTPQNYACSPL